MAETKVQDRPMRRGGFRILLVEDHWESHDITARLLRGLNHEVVTADGASEALAIAEPCDLDLVVIDVGLPDGSGIELMREIHEQCGVFGIALGGHVIDVDLPMTHAGFREALLKPVDLRALEAAIRRVAKLPKE